MLTLLSPAKKLLEIKTLFHGLTTTPRFLDKTCILIDLLKQKSEVELEKLMNLSKKLAQLNRERFQQFKTDNEASSYSYPALYLFQGDVYKSLDAQSLDNYSIHFSSEHLGLLSGLYGLLRPLDMIQPYRLEMGTHLSNPAGKDLYSFWEQDIVSAINQQLLTHKNPILLNLASQEYNQVINKNRLKYPMITVHFKENKNGKLSVIGIHAKKARGAMARAILQHQIDDISSIKSLTLLNYMFDEKTSDENNLVFIR